MDTVHFPPMHRMRGALPAIKTPEVKALLETLISSVTAQADLYACLLFLETLAKEKDAKNLFSRSIVLLSNDFPSGIFTSTTTIDDLIEKIRCGEFVPDARNRIIVAFTSIFEAAVTAAMSYFNIQAPTGNQKFQDFNGATYETKTVNQWLKLYRETIAQWSNDKYFTQAVNTHAATYWSNLYKSRNQIVHDGGRAKQDQVSLDGKPWGVTAVGQPIKTVHNKVDDVIQFFDNSFGKFLCDLDKFP